MSLELPSTLQAWALIAGVPLAFLAAAGAIYWVFG